MNHQRSQELFQRAQKHLVGGVNSPVRSFKRVGGHPIFAKEADGPWLTDVDGNQYIDLVMSYGPHLFGHRRKEIVEAVQAAAGKSFCYGLSSEGEIEWAELLLKRFPKAEKVRMLSSGTEACATAIRLARGITNREIVVKCAGHYHGHVDSLLVDGGSGLATLSAEANPDSKGLPEAVTKLSRVIPFNNLEAAKSLFDKEGAKIACIILEPVMGNMGVVPPNVDFLRGLRDLCTKHGALLIFDEVMTGLRVDYFSAQGRFGITPDLTTLGKIVGGGLPVAALLGKAQWMDHLAPLGPVYQAGTLSGNPVGVAAGIAMLKLIDLHKPYTQFEEMGAQLEQVVARAAERKKIDLRVERVGAMISFYFRKDPVKNADDCRDVDQARFNKFFWNLIKHGIMIPPSPFEACFLSTALSEISAKDWEQRMGRVFEEID